MPLVWPARKNRHPEENRMSEAGGSVAGAAGTIVGILGVGAMARRLLNKGYRVVVRDIVAERVDALVKLGAVPAASAAAVAGPATSEFTVVVDSRQTDDVLFGAAGARSLSDLR
jgi:3-hydroxyisobutyrate dehydrogenase-like beta-hydroxyacid dehydrogenase